MATEAKLTGVYLVFHVADRQSWFINRATSPADAKTQVISQLKIEDERERFFYQHTLKATLVEISK